MSPFPPVHCPLLPDPICATIILSSYCFTTAHGINNHLRRMHSGCEYQPPLQRRHAQRTRHFRHFSAGMRRQDVEKQSGTVAVKRAFPEMLKGGVIMDVMSVEQAR